VNQDRANQNYSSAERLVDYESRWVASNKHLYLLIVGLRSCSALVPPTSQRRTYLRTVCPLTQKSAADVAIFSPAPTRRAIRSRSVRWCEHFCGCSPGASAWLLTDGKNQFPKSAPNEHPMAQSQLAITRSRVRRLDAPLDSLLGSAVEWIRKIDLSLWHCAACSAAIS